MTVHGFDRELAHLFGDITVTSREFPLKEFRIKCPTIKIVPNSAELVLLRFKNLLVTFNITSQLENAQSKRIELVKPLLRKKLLKFSDQIKMRGEGRSSSRKIDWLDDEIYSEFLLSATGKMRSLMDTLKPWHYWDSRINDKNEFSVFVSEEGYKKYPELVWLLELCGAEDVKETGWITNHDLLTAEQLNQLYERAINVEPDFDYVAESSAFNAGYKPSTIKLDPAQTETIEKLKKKAKLPSTEIKGKEDLDGYRIGQWGWLFTVMFFNFVATFLALILFLVVVR